MHEGKRWNLTSTSQQNAKRKKCFGKRTKGDSYTKSAANKWGWYSNFTRKKGCTHTQKNFFHVELAWSSKTITHCFHNSNKLSISIGLGNGQIWIYMLVLTYVTSFLKRERVSKFLFPFFKSYQHKKTRQTRTTLFVFFDKCVHVM